MGSRDEYTLIHDGTPVANVTDVEYETPWYSGRCTFHDAEFGRRMVEVCAIGVWLDEQPDDMPDAAWYAELERRGITEADEQAHARGAWVVRSPKGAETTTTHPLFEANVVSWRPLG